MQLSEGLPNYWALPVPWAAPEARRLWVKNKKTPRERSVFTPLLDKRRLEADGVPGNAADVAAADPEVVEFTIAHAVEFAYGFAVLAPVVEFACDVHGLPLFAAAGSASGAG